MSREYTIEVLETRVVLVEYVVEADSESEALKKAESGDTLDESELACRDVLSRIPLQETLSLGNE